jgi:hypothetical protein
MKRAQWAAFAVGYGVIVFGAVGLLRAVPLRAAGQVASWVVAADVLHDFVLAPLVCVIGFVVARFVPPIFRWPVRAGAIGTAFVFLLAYPALRGFGRETAPGNTSVQPLDYPTAVLTAVGIVWGVALIWAVSNWTLQRSRGRGAEHLETA